jgi:hypothetical protein
MTEKPNIIKDACTDSDLVFNYDMSTAPYGQRCLLLGLGGVATVSTCTKDSFWIGWAPLHKRDKAEERRRGLKL